ncbi:MAG: YkgJ family cysteine cluster protein [Deltaproteobacteria bacterium]
MEQIIPDGYCLGCRGCCRFSHSEGPWLPQLLNGEKKRHAEGVRVVACDEKQGCAFRCVHLDTGANTCAIYRTRPFECRLYPFVLNRRDGKFFLSVDPNCRYIEEHSGGKDFKAYADRVRRFLAAPEVIEELRCNRDMFQSYTDVRDIAELPV